MMKRILIVDDMEANRYLLEATLRGYGYETVSAHDGAEALATARTRPPDLVISDILMPVMDGFALCRQWRADEKLRGIPFIFYTATYTDPKDGQLALDLGADRFVLKPQEPQVMHEIVRDVLARGAKTAVPGATKVLPDEIVTLRKYNEVLVRKLEKKLNELEATHQQLLEDTRQRHETEASLRQSEAKYRTLIERMGEGLIHVDDEDIILFVNPRICQMLGYTEAELLGQHAGTLLNREEDRPAMVERNRQRTQGIAEGYEIQLRKKSGEFLWAWNTATPVMAAAGRPSGSMAIIADITERKQSEALSNGQKQVLEMIAVSSPLPETLTTLLRVIEAQSDEMLCSILLLDPDGVHLRHGAAPSLPTEYTHAIDGVGIGSCVGSCGTAAFRREAVIVEDIATDPLWADYRALALAHGLRACWSTPILDEQQRVLGTFAIYYRQPGRPTALHRRCIDLATSLAAIAIGRTRAEAVLQMMRFSVDHAGDGVFWISPEGRVLYANESNCKRLGYSESELLTMKIFDLDPDYQPGVWAPHWEELKQRGTMTFETRHRTRTGRVFPIEVNANYVCAGGQEFNFAFIRDITERRRAEDALQLFRAQVDRVNDAIEVIDPETTRFLDINERGCLDLGYTREEMLSLTVADIDPLTDSPEFALKMEELRKTDSVRLESLHRRKDGSTFPVEVSIKRVRLERDYLVTVARDITERRRAEQQLEESREQLRALLTRLQQAREEERIRVSREIHDELGQLLTGLKMDVRWLERKLSEPGLPPALNPLLDRAVAASELTDATIATVQKIAAELRPSTLDQLGLEAALTQEARRFEDRSGIRCTVAVADSWPVLPPEIANELFYICQEALTNVARHARATSVEVRLKTAGGDMILEVSDDGVGIAEADLNAPRSLGLLGMRERVIQCGGTLSFQPNEPRGTRVTARVPMRNDE